MTYTPELDAESIKKEAQQAAFFHDHINAACPYPFESAHGQLFKAAFLEAKKIMADTLPGAQA